MGIRFIDGLDLKGKRVFIRVDFNVPLDSEGKITDDTRIRASLPTINFAREQRARLILSSQLGRPKGKPNIKMSLKPAALRLSELIGTEVRFAPDCIGDDAERVADGLAPGDVLLLENLRFHPEEEKNDPDFARKLARMSDVYINDAFGTAHRAHASTEGLPRLVKESGAGFLMKRELEHLEGLLGNPERPFAVILGGAKVSDKLGVIHNLIGRTDTILIGGGMAYTFLKSRQVETGNSKVEEEMVDEAGKMLETAGSRDTKILLPIDHVTADRFEEGVQGTSEPEQSIPPGRLGLDIGPKTVKLFQKEIAAARTIFWNGPMGVFEWPGFDSGTMAVARAVAESGAVKVAGGGDTIAAIEKAKVTDRFTHISTGGGASLELLEGKKLPGVEILRRNP